MLSPLPQPTPFVGTRKRPCLSVSRGAGRGADPWCVSASETAQHKCPFVCGGGMCVFPLPYGYFHLLGPDSVLRAVNSDTGDKELSQ